MSEAAAYRRWQPAPLAGGDGRAGDLAARRRQAAEEGYRAGYKAGLAAAEDVARRLAALLASSEDGLRLIEERLAGELLDLAIEIARHVVRAEVSARRDAVLPVAREALGMLSKEAREVRLAAHPADAALLRTHLAEEIERGGWQVAEDHHIEPGGMRVVSSAGDVDATLGTRWRRALSGLGQDHSWHESAD
jgi:flagellar assembly protein FliH